VKVAISEGNTKLGTVPNINLPPGPAGSCRKDAPCWTSGCYARKAWRQYPNVREAWTRNWDIWSQNPMDYELQLHDYLFKRKPERFRWHSAGDIPDQGYFDMMVRVAIAHTGTKFLVFTKKYELDLEHKRPNLSVIYSRWPGLPFPKELKGEVQAHFEDGDQYTYDAMDDFVACPGSCKKCSRCWSPRGSVLFVKH
jgi:hypothetical protein